MSELRAEILELLREVDGRPYVDLSDDQALELDSLVIIQLHDRLEQRFDVRIRARELTPESFGTLGGLLALITAKRSAGAGPS